MTQQFVDMIQGGFARLNAERKASATNMKLGELIDQLTAVTAPTKCVITLAGTSAGRFMSYRGYYEDLCLTPDDREWCTVSDLLERAKEALGAVMTGYKGGDYPMHRDSLVWLASHGNSGGIALTGIEERECYVVLHGTPTSDC